MRRIGHRSICCALLFLGAVFSSFPESKAQGSAVTLPNVSACLSFKDGVALLTDESEMALSNYLAFIEGHPGNIEITIVDISYTYPDSKSPYGLKEQFRRSDKDAYFSAIDIGAQKIQIIRKFIAASPGITQSGIYRAEMVFRMANLTSGGCSESGIRTRYNSRQGVCGSDPKESCQFQCDKDACK